MVDVSGRLEVGCVGVVSLDETLTGVVGVSLVVDSTNVGVVVADVGAAVLAGAALGAGLVTTVTTVTTVVVVDSIVVRETGATSSGAIVEDEAVVSAVDADERGPRVASYLRPFAFHYADLKNAVCWMCQRRSCLRRVC